jgi:hypothetical protein
MIRFKDRFKTTQIGDYIRTNELLTDKMIKEFKKLNEESIELTLKENEKRKWYKNLRNKKWQIHKAFRSKTGINMYNYSTVGWTMDAEINGIMAWLKINKFLLTGKFKTYIAQGKHIIYKEKTA